MALVYNIWLPLVLKLSPAAIRVGEVCRLPIHGENLHSISNSASRSKTKTYGHDMNSYDI